MSHPNLSRTIPLDRSWFYRYPQHSTTGRFDQEHLSEWLGKLNSATRNNLRTLSHEDFWDSFNSWEQENYPKLNSDEGGVANGRVPLSTLLRGGGNGASDRRIRLALSIYARSQRLYPHDEPWRWVSITDALEEELARISDMVPPLEGPAPAGVGNDWRLHLPEKRRQFDRTIDALLGAQIIEIRTTVDRDSTKRRSGIVREVRPRVEKIRVPDKWSYGERELPTKPLNVPSGLWDRGWLTALSGSAILCLIFLLDRDFLADRPSLLPFDSLAEALESEIRVTCGPMIASNARMVAESLVMQQSEDWDSETRTLEGLPQFPVEFVCEDDRMRVVRGSLAEAGFASVDGMSVALSDAVANVISGRSTTSEAPKRMPILLTDRWVLLGRTRSSHYGIGRDVWRTGLSELEDNDLVERVKFRHQGQHPIWTYRLHASYLDDRNPQLLGE